MSHAVPLAIRVPRRLTWRHTLTRALDWYRSLDSQPMTDRVAFVTFGASEFLEATVRPGMRVLEFGAGGSTLFFTDRGTELVTIEHAPRWAEDVAGALETREGRSWRLHVVEPVAGSANGAEPADPDSFASSEPGYEGMSFRDYVATIDRYPAGHFDLVLVDGRARASCFKRALPKVRPGGFVVLDDSEREEYRPAMALAGANRWRRSDFYGPGPYYADGFWQTSVWQRLE